MGNRLKDTIKDKVFQPIKDRAELKDRKRRKVKIDGHWYYFDTRIHYLNFGPVDNDSDAPDLDDRTFDKGFNTLLKDTTKIHIWMFSIGAISLMVIFSTLNFLFGFNVGEFMIIGIFIYQAFVSLFTRQFIRGIK